MDIAGETPVEICCVFFTRGFVEQVALDAASALEPALDVPGRLAPPCRIYRLFTTIASARLPVGYLPSRFAAGMRLRPARGNRIFC